MLKIVIALAVLILDGYSLADNSGLISGKPVKNFFGYYTTLSNILIWVYFIFVFANLLCGVCDFVNNPIVCFTVMMSINLTFLIYHFLLSKLDIQNYKEGKTNWNPYGLINLSFHYICPLLTIAFWLLCNDKTNLKVLDGLYWVAIPVSYIFYTIIRANAGITFDDHGTRWPYDFINFDRHGAKKILINIAVLFILFSLLGLLMALVGTIVR